MIIPEPSAHDLEFPADAAYLSPDDASLETAYMQSQVNLWIRRAVHAERRVEELTAALRDNGACVFCFAQASLPDDDGDAAPDPNVSASAEWNCPECGAANAANAAWCDACGLDCPSPF